MGNWLKSLYIWVMEWADTKWGLGILFIAPFIPVPYKLFSISAGVFDMNIPIFSLGTLIGQGLRFYLLSFLIIKIGPGIKKMLELNKKSIAIAVTVCIAISIMAITMF